MVILFGGHHLISLVLGAGGACGQWFGLLVGEMEAGGWKYQELMSGIPRATARPK